MATAVQSINVTPGTKICESFLLFFLSAIVACASVCVCVCPCSSGWVCAMKGGREGGSNDTPGTFCCSVICKVTYLQVMSGCGSRNSFSIIWLMEVTLLPKCLPVCVQAHTFQSLFVWFQLHLSPLSYSFAPSLKFFQPLPPQHNMSVLVFPT